MSDMPKFSHYFLGLFSCLVFVPGQLAAQVVINEVMYNPSVHPDELGEYIELFNHSSRTVTLYDPAHPSNTWKFTQGIDYTFPTGVSIPAGAHLLVVRTDPDLFRLIHGIPASRPIRSTTAAISSSALNGSSSSP